MKVEDVKKIGIIGCGILGTTLAAAAAPDYEILVKRRDISNGLDDEAIKRISKCFPSMVRKNLITETQKDTSVSHITITDNFNDLKDCQIIFDAIPDILELKTENFALLDTICPPETIFLITSACVSVTTIASGSGRPDRVMTSHFLTPVHIYTLVEVAPAVQTSQKTIDFTLDFLERGLHRTIVRCKDLPGLIQDNFLFAYFTHAIKTLEAGFGTVEDIDTVIKAGFGVQLGPFELMDHMGLPPIIPATKAIYDQTLDKTYAPHPLLIKMVEAGYSGRKVGKGWYTWDDKGRKTGITKVF
jgi:3-hydroxybutyryl-CoA dehydrogenase